MKRISDVVRCLKSLEDAYGDLPIWLEIDYHAYDDNASKKGPVRHNPFTSTTTRNGTVVIISANHET